MLLFQLLPYFLAVRIQNGDWKYGAEYTFDGRINMITSMDIDKGDAKGTALYYKLKCRPREPNILKCSIENSKIIRLKNESIAYTIDDKEPDIEKDYWRIMNLEAKPFEINFNEFGIDSYTMENEPPYNSFSLNVARLIANQLNIGIDLSDEMRAKYKGLENSTFGECDVDYHVTRMPIDTNQYNHSFELVSLERLGKFVDEIIEIDKNRNVKDCIRCVKYFFPTRYTLGLIYRDSIIKLKTSNTRMKISKHKLFTETVNESDIFNETRIKVGKVLDHFRLELESVTQAKDQLDKFKKPITLGVIPQADENEKMFW